MITLASRGSVIGRGRFIFGSRRKYSTGGATTTSSITRLLSTDNNNNNDDSYSKEKKKKRKKVAVTARAFNETYEKLHLAGLSVTRNESIEPWSHEQLKTNIYDANAILAFMTDCFDEVLLDPNITPNLEIIACALKGYDNFNIELCKSRGITVTAVPNLLTEPTADLAILLSLGLMRRIREADNSVRSGQFKGWRPTLYGTSFTNEIVGLYGFGEVGHAIAKRIHGFSPMCIYYVDPRNNIRHQYCTDDDDTSSNNSNNNVHKLDTLEELMQKCDVLFVCTPLNETTYHSINSNTLGQAKAGIHIINISRGSCVDESAIADGLDTGHIHGYAADVYEFEDWILADNKYCGNDEKSDTTKNKNNKRPTCIDPRLLIHPRTLFSPHLGSAVTSIRRDIESAAADEIVRWTKGDPYMYRVN